jgi:ATP-dependent Lhr-like helicase
LPARVPGYRSHHLDQLLASGEIVWAGIEPIGQNDGRVALYLSDREALLARDPDPEARPASPLHEQLRELLSRRGALFFAEIARALGVFPKDALEALWDLVWASEVTNDTLEPLRTMGRAGKRERESRRARVLRHSRPNTPPGSEGRWSLRRSRWESDPSPTEKRTAAARALLERYGLVLREAAGAEALPSGFGYVYDVLRAMEEQGRVRRGYFVAGRGATQFALPGAEERLRTKPEDEPAPLFLAATDPANPYGSLVPWPASKGAQRAPGARVVLVGGKPLAWIARGGTHVVTFLPPEEPDATHAAEMLARAIADDATRRGRSAMVATIDDIPALESPLARAFAEAGFVARQGALVRLAGEVHEDDA